MTDQNTTSTGSAEYVKADARDLLARLYREIGISAVAAALSVNVADAHEREAAPDQAPGFAPSRNDIAA